MLKKISGGKDGKETPVPMPNTEVKLTGAEDTKMETSRENMKLPGNIWRRILNRYSPSFFLFNEITEYI